MKKPKIYFTPIVFLVLAYCASTPHSESNDSSQTTTDSVSKKKAAGGHDTDNFMAPDGIYAKLPGYHV